MVYSISDCESVDQYVVMENDPGVKSRKKKLNSSKISDCGQCENAIMDVVGLIVVVSACGFLVYPCVKLILITFVQIVGECFCVLKEEASQDPMVYAYFGLGMLFTGFVVWRVLEYIDRKCGNPDCKGLRRKTVEFDFQLENDESLKDSTSSLGKDNYVEKGCLLELPRDHHREWEAKLKRMAPSNGKAVLVFRARCGCCIGRMEIPGPKKPRKLKK